MDKPKRSKMISVRASAEEIERVKRLAGDLIKKNPHLKEANILRELLGLVDTGIVTAEMRWRLSHPDDHGPNGRRDKSDRNDPLTRPYEEGDDLEPIFDEEAVSEPARKKGSA